VLIAGGAPICILMNKPVADVDIFIYGLDEIEANKKANSVVNMFSKGTITRSANCLTITLDPDAGDIRLPPIPLSIPSADGTHLIHTMYEATWRPLRKAKYQIILRLYKSKSEILMGFDVDSCCIGFDGKDVYMSPRCLYSISHMLNTVNLKRASPTYTYRLAKYMHRGFAIHVPNLDNDRIKEYSAEADEHYMNCIGDGIYRSGICRRYLKNLNGLSYLLAMSRIRLYSEFVVHSDYESNGAKYKKLTEKETNALNEYKTARGLHLSMSSNSAVQSCVRYDLGKKFTIDKLNISDDMYSSLIFTIPQQVTWKVQNPGEQMTNTFNKMHIGDPESWYVGKYYRSSKEQH
jgi:hypothetical protein